MVAYCQLIYLILTWLSLREALEQGTLIVTRVRPPVHDDGHMTLRMILWWRCIHTLAVAKPVGTLMPRYSTCATKIQLIDECECEMISGDGDTNSPIDSHPSQY